MHYEGSIGIDKDLITAGNFKVDEQVHVLSETTGERLVTYVIEEPAGSGKIVLNGPAAHRIKTGEILIILAYGIIDETELDKFKPAVIYLDKNNKLTKVLIYPEKSQSMNLAFDITPAKYVTGLITEKGVCNASKEGLESLFK